MVELDKKNIEQKLFSSDYKFEDSSVFKELMTLYPWCSSFTVVYLKSLSLTNDMRFQKELEEYAVQLNSREVIYDLLHGVNLIDEKEEAVKEDETKLDTSDIEKENDVENHHVEPEETENEPIDKDEELEKLIISNVISDNLINEIREEEHTANRTIPQESIDDNSATQNEFIEEKLEFDDRPKTFNAWLRQGDKTNIEDSSKEYLTFEKPKKDFFKPQTTAKESIAKKNLPVSETLAKVFESQGNYIMAISTYEQLSLIFPEKKIFFANQIEQINSKII